MRVLLLKPSFSVPTPDAYGRWRESQEILGIRYAAQEIGSFFLINDLERPVFEKHRFLAELKQWLLERSETSASLMSGSGSTVFAILHDGADSETVIAAALAELDPRLWHWAGFTEA
jgi:4-diphosphocytidyl-2-C-methyl-D-erythritol kinase